MTERKNRDVIEGRGGKLEISNIQDGHGIYNGILETVDQIFQVTLMPPKSHLSLGISMDDYLPSSDRDFIIYLDGSEYARALSSVMHATSLKR